MSTITIDLKRLPSLRGIIRKTGKTKEQLAVLCECNASTIYFVDDGTTRYPRFKTAILLISELQKAT
jgi:hypothetical protein